MLAYIKNWNSNDAIRLIGLMTIVTFTIVVVVGGIGSNEQVTAIVGFLGTIAGYLAGSKEVIST